MWLAGVATTTTLYRSPGYMGSGTDSCYMLRKCTARVTVSVNCKVAGVDAAWAEGSHALVFTNGEYRYHTRSSNTGCAKGSTRPVDEEGAGGGGDCIGGYWQQWLYYEGGVIVDEEWELVCPVIQTT